MIKVKNVEGSVNGEPPKPISQSPFYAQDLQ